MAFLPVFGRNGEIYGGYYTPKSGQLIALIQVFAFARSTTQDQADGLTADKEELLSELATAKEDKARLEKENLRLNQAIEQNGKEE